VHVWIIHCKLLLLQAQIFVDLAPFNTNKLSIPFLSSASLRKTYMKK
jgi:hypothetical protein